MFLQQKDNFFHLSRGTILTEKNIHLYNLVLINFLGGTFGNYLYRILHKNLLGFPELLDDYKFVNGNSHTINYDQYLDDIGQKNLTDKFIFEKEKFTINKDIIFENLALKKHCYNRIGVNNYKLHKLARLNINIRVENSLSLVFASIQNMIKNEDFIKFYETHNNVKNSWIQENHLDKNNLITEFLQVMVSSTHKSWFNQTNTHNVYVIDFCDFLDSEKLYNHLLNISKKLNVGIRQEFEQFSVDHDIFLTNQKYLESFYRAQSKQYDKNNIVDLILQNFN